MNRNRILIAIGILILVAGSVLLIKSRKGHSVFTAITPQTASPKVAVINKNNPEKTSGAHKAASIKEIKEKYGKIEILTMRNGAQYTGAATFNGDSIKFETETGIMILDVKDVKEIRIIR